LSPPETQIQKRATKGECSFEHSKCKEAENKTANEHAYAVPTTESTVLWNANVPILIPCHTECTHPLGETENAAKRSRTSILSDAVIQRFSALKSPVPHSLSRCFPFAKKYVSNSMYEKDKAIPVEAWTGREGCRRLRFPDLKNLIHEGDKVASPTHRPPLSPRKYSWYSFLLEAESNPGP
jgi:hypothetical protein